MFYFFLPISLSSHEFWLQPNQFIYQRGEKINIRFRVSENLEEKNWTGTNQNLQMLKHYFGKVSDDLSNGISLAPGDSLQWIMEDEGTCLVACQSTNLYQELPAGKFNEYLKDYGLTEVADYRIQHNETDSAGREYYQHCAKTLFQVGKIKDNTYAVITHLPVDIIPLSNPYSLKPGDSLIVKILFRELPLANTPVKIWHRVNNQTVQHRLISNPDGKIKFPVSLSGFWMVSVVKTEQRGNTDSSLHSAAEWQSYRGSLTWGYE